MAVQQNKIPFKAWHAYDFLTNPPLAIESSTEVHLRHHISPNGYYRQEGC